MMKRMISLLLALVLTLALPAWGAMAELIPGALLLSYEQDGRRVQLHLTDGDYDWQNDPEGLLWQLVGQQVPLAVKPLNEEPRAVMQMSLSMAEKDGVQLMGGLSDYVCAARSAAQELDAELPDDSTLAEAFAVLLGEEAEMPVLCSEVWEADWLMLSTCLWGEYPVNLLVPEEEPAFLTYGTLFFTLTNALPEGEVRTSLIDYQAAFEVRGDQNVSWAELLCVLAEVLTPQREGLPYLVFSGEKQQRLNLRGEQPVYSVKLYVDGVLHDTLEVIEGTNAALPRLSGVTWVGSSERIMADTILNGYTTKRITFRLVNAGEFAELLGDSPTEWVQNVLYDHRLRASSYYVGALTDKGLQVTWPEIVGRRVHDDQVVEGVLSLMAPPVTDSATPAPTASPAPTSAPTAAPSVSPTAAPTASASASPTASIAPSVSPEATATAAPSVSPSAAPTATPVPVYTVTFVFPPELGYPEGEATVRQQVSAGQAATPPAVDGNRLPEHYTFSWPGGWEKVTQDTTITGVLTPNTYTIRFRVQDAAGVEIYNQEHAHVYGSALVMPSIELAAGQKVVWDNLPTQITGSCEITGRVQAIEPVVTYRLVNLDGTVTELGSEKVPYGGNATLPNVQIPEGCEITWSGTLSNLTADTVVTGTISQRRHTVTITIYNPDGSVYFTETQSVSHGGSAVAPAFTVPVGYTFAWDSGTNFDNVTEDRILTGHLQAVPAANS